MPIRSIFLVVVGAVLAAYMVGFDPTKFIVELKSALVVIGVVATLVAIIAAACVRVRRGPYPDE